MVWDYAEANPFCKSSGNWIAMVDWTTKALAHMPGNRHGFAQQHDAATQNISINKVISTDPPYYDNIGYADLSDFFYVWMRRSLRAIYPNLFSTLAVPKAEELVASPYRHGSKKKAEVVHDMLVTLGVSDNQISFKGMGDGDATKAAAGKVEIMVEGK